MGLIIRLIAGAVVGVFIAQNYDVPNVKKLARTALLFADHIDQNYRKPSKDE